VVFSRSPSVTEFEIGSIQAVLLGDGGACSKAIEAYLGSLSR
jgi:hypothetical protein